MISEYDNRVLIIHNFSLQEIYLIKILLSVSQKDER